MGLWDFIVGKRSKEDNQRAAVDTFRRQEQQVRASILGNELLTAEQRAGMTGRIDQFFKESGGKVNNKDFFKLADTLKEEMGQITQTVEQRQKATSASLEAQRTAVNPRLTSRDQIASTYFGAVSQPQKKAGGFVSEFALPKTAAQQGQVRK